jgi:DNA-binding response OmpR family regulator
MKILLIEDEIELAKSIREYLISNDFVCEWAKNKREAMDKITAFDYDCVLLDLMLPVYPEASGIGDGFDILLKIKELGKNDGIIIISAKETLDTRIEGFNLGADDYLTKPFHLSELLVRIQALIRRKNFDGNNAIVFNEIEVNLLAKTVKVHGKLMEITKKEFDLLLYLIGNKNRVLSKSAIAEHLSGDMADMLDNHDFVYAHAKNLKNKLRAANANEYIKTVYGLGYKWT